jgi:hypothetical protein
MFRISSEKAVAGALLAAVLILGGCSGSSETKVQAGAINYNSAEGQKSNAPSASATRMRYGKAPLAHMVTGQGYVFVKDATEGKWVADRDVRGTTTVQIDQKRGISIGDRVVVGGPLPADHFYELWLDRQPLSK